MLRGYMYLADRGSTDCRSVDHVLQQIHTLPAPLGVIPSHLVDLFASSEGLANKFITLALDFAHDKIVR